MATSPSRRVDPGDLVTMPHGTPPAVVRVPHGEARERHSWLRGSIPLIRSNMPSKRYGSAPGPYPGSVGSTPTEGSSLPPKRYGSARGLYPRSLGPTPRGGSRRVASSVVERAAVNRLIGVRFPGSPPTRGRRRVPDQVGSIPTARSPCTRRSPGEHRLDKPTAAGPIPAVCTSTCDSAGADAWPSPKRGGIETRTGH